MQPTIERLLSTREMDEVRRPLAAASLLPARAYSSADIFEIERTTIFPRSWMPVCHVSQLPDIGSFVAKDIGGEPVLAVRDREGEVRVLANVCRHRNMKLKTGAGKCAGRRITCLYHGWSYGLDGSLLTAPHMQEASDFDKADYGLPSIRHAIWHGFVFANLDGHAPSLSDQLGGLEQFAGHYRFEDMVALDLKRVTVDWNWKVSLENFSEAYHQPLVHAATAEKFSAGSRSVYHDNDGGMWSSFFIPNVNDQVLPTLVPPVENLPERSHRGAMVINIYPYFHLITDAATPLWLDFGITEHHRHELIWRMLFPKSAVTEHNRAALVSEAAALFLPVIDEDVAICQGIAAGTKSMLAKPGRLSHMEKVVHQFQNWWLDQATSRS